MTRVPVVVLNGFMTKENTNQPIPPAPNANQRIKELLAEGYTQGRAMQQALIEKREWIAKYYGGTK